MKHLLRAFAALALILALSACTDDPVGIFASLGRETELSDGTKEFRSASPNFVFKVGAYYYAGIGGLWRRPVSGGAWSRGAHPAGAGPLATSGGANNAATLGYVLFQSEDGAKPYSFDGTTWTYIDPAAIPAGAVADGIFKAGNSFFLATHRVDTAPETDVTYAELLSDAGFPTSNFGGELPGGTVTAVGLDGGTYFAAIGSTVRSGGLGSINVDSDSTFGDVGGFVDAGGGVFLASGSSGKLAEWTGAWTLSGTFDNPEGDAARLTGMVVVPANDGGTALLVGSRSWGDKAAAGYFEFDADAFAIASASPTDYDLVADETNFATSLAGKSVNKFFYDDRTTEGTLFALTTGAGLWSNEWNGSAWSGWDRE